MALRAARSGGMFPPTDRPEIRVIEVAFGAVQHPRLGSHPKARLWLIAGPEPAPLPVNPAAGDQSPNGSVGAPEPDTASSLLSELAVYLPGPAPPGWGRGGLSNDFPVRH